MNNPSPPTEASLREAAVAHLARYAATRAGLARVLARRVDRWATRARDAGDREAVAEQAAQAKQLIEKVVARLAELGVIDDKSFAASRARGLARGGHSARSIEARLRAKGVPGELARQAEDPVREMGAALVAAKKRRIGPFAPPDQPPDPDSRRKAWAALARSGFGEKIARDLFRLSREEAEEQLRAWQRGLE